MDEVQPELDTSALTQANQAMAFNVQGQQAQLVVGVDVLKQSTAGVDQSGAAASMQTVAVGERPSKRRRKSTDNAVSAQLPPIERDQSVPNYENVQRQNKRATRVGTPVSLPSLIPKKANQCTQTMPTDEFLPPLPPKVRRRYSEQQGKLPSLNNPPCSSSTTSSCATAASVIPPESNVSCRCAMCEMTQKKLADERNKSMTMQNILSVELDLKKEKPSPPAADMVNEPRQRVFSVPTKR